jgi:LysR family carnitine catabolism transcriptional activator
MGASRDLAELRRGIVTVAAVPSLAATLLPRVVAEFSQSYPGVSVRLRDSGASLIELVKSGDVDLGVGGDTNRDPAVAIEDLYAEPICVFALPNHALAGLRSVTLEEVTKHPMILPQRHSSLRTILQRALDQRKLSFHRFHETSHLSTTIGMVNAGLGIAIMPLRAIDCFLSSSIRCIPIREPALERRVVIATKAGKSVSPAVQKLIEILHRAVREFPPRVQHGRLVRTFGDPARQPKRPAGTRTK